MLESVYRPAAEVGGEFLPQVIPLQSGRTLVVIGCEAARGCVRP